MLLLISLMEDCGEDLVVVELDDPPSQSMISVVICLFSSEGVVGIVLVTQIW